MIVTNQLVAQLLNLKTKNSKQEGTQELKLCGSARFLLERCMSQGTDSISACACTYPHILYIYTHFFFFLATFTKAIGLEGFKRPDALVNFLAGNQMSPF